MNKQWYLLYVRKSKEAKITTLLSSKHIESFCPLNSKIASNNKRSKVQGELLFPSYVFVKATNEEVATFNSMRYVINPVYWKNKPVVIPEEYINAIMQFILKYNNISVQKRSIYSNPNKKVIRLITDHLEELTLPAIGYQLTATIPELHQVDVRFLLNEDSSTIGQGLHIN